MHITFDDGITLKPFIALTLLIALIIRTLDREVFDWCSPDIRILFSHLDYCEVLSDDFSDFRYVSAANSGLTLYNTKSDWVTSDHADELMAEFMDDEFDGCTARATPPMHIPLFRFISENVKWLQELALEHPCSGWFWIQGSKYTGAKGD